MDRKFLEGMGLEKETIDRILDQNGTEVSQLNARIKAKDTEISTLRSDLTTANSTLASAQDRIKALEAVDVESLQKQLQAEKDGRAADARRYRLDAFLAAQHCTDADYIRYKIGDTVEYTDDGELKDADGLAKTLLEKYPQHFEAVKSEDHAGTGGTGNFGRDRSESTPAADNPYTTDGWNLTKQMELEVTDPTKAQKLMAEAKK